MTYDELLMQSDNEGLFVKEKPLSGNNGRITGRRIAIRRNIPTTVEKACVLAEELGHYYTSAGNILDLSDIRNRKQELKARMWAYNNQIGLIGLVRAFDHGCRNLHETADYLGVSEPFLAEALEQYRQKYGICATVDNYIIYFEPNLRIGKMI